MAARIRRRLIRGAATTALAAAAMAALSASQAPAAFLADGGDRPGDSQPDDIALEDTATGGSPYFTDLPPLNDSGDEGGSPDTQGGTEAGIPATVLQAYKKAANELGRTRPGCNLEWQLLAAIGKVESGHARGGAVDAFGTTRSKILGPVLNGDGFASITDTDHGAYDGDTTYDRAVGPMQFIPGTWDTWQADGNADGKKDPNNIFDATLAAGSYLCADGRDLGTTAGRERAILSYNNSQDYLSTVLYWYGYYKNGAHSIPDGTGTLPTHRSDEPSGSGDPGADASPKPKPKPSPGPSDTPGTGGSTPPADPTPPSQTPTPPALTVTRLQNTGTGRQSAPQGHMFAEPVTVKAADAGGKGVGKVKVRFTIVGATDARFAGGAADATVTTASGGTATAPTLVAGEQTGTFTVRATVVDRPTVTLDVAATVTVRLADALTRVDGGEALSTTESTEFAPGLKFKATDGDTPVAGTGVTATIVTSADTPDQVTAGPHFNDADGTAVRSVTLTSDSAGLIAVPQLYADATTGSFALRLTADGGKTVYVTLTVTAAPAPDPTPTPTPTETPQTPAP
ncbi:hypothetical protein SRB5_69610 [Streptomyces sp. RB5]|uniref:Lytic transglycosylase n=1 Tax=Streptomyces smaragdinus TaxID=2585196 RepID=A0A7K0CTJ8_9ACTN|nr:lytic transglycosylase [Streptomyces smaragdinus]MQY16758.1 hypothetical protein [Streptomyces smaragdinus]